ncbi:MYND-type domain-containing protein [Mycena sanguinolenta]|uniref:phytol kinase n=1 Tax=Mycena sanguinolenta TaxID=230812 RepID=A0A8H6Y2D3_9AGAR|nr:MYND-type domain-containing protein [Mycena sanguinolenta]
MHESLSLAHVSKLPSYLRARAKAAKNGSSSDLTFLLRFVPATDTKRMLLLPLIFVHLDPSGIPTSHDLDSILSDTSRHQELDRITGALAALHAISEMLDPQSVISPDAYTDLWPRVYQWTIFVHGHWEVIPGMDLGAAYRATAINILTFHREASLEAAVDKAPGLRYIIAEYWSKIMRGDISTDVQFPPILTFLFNSTGSKDKTKFMEIVEGCGGSGSLAYLLVQQINHIAAGQVTEPAIEGMNAVIQVLWQHGKPLLTGILDHGGAKALIDAISFCEEARYSDLEAGEKVHVGVIYLLGCLESRAGATWVSQALSAGLLRFIAVLGRARQTETDVMFNTYSMLQRILRYILPNLLTDYKLVRQIPDALPEALSITSTQSFSTCIIYPFWTEFIELVRERLGALDFWLERRSMSPNSCENSQCRKAGPKGALKKCAGCGLAWYCSRECQTADWAAVHRASCRALKMTDLSGARQRDYIRAILQHNFKSPEIITTVLLQQARFMYANPGVDFLTVYDFTRNGRGIDSTKVRKSTPAWSQVKPRSDYAGAPGARLAHLLQSAGNIHIHLIVLSFELVNPHEPKRVVPMWSTPQVRDELSRVVQAFPRGLQSSALDAALVKPLRALATRAAKPMQDVYY